ncbi:hypothetical protein N657DRAFT_654829 [Parathielavia appendiculata]|uniref:Apple domain-containing protein n=1 Tax=Parathielavia appendiculata TaxID=2587402 RepID=A0AAN6Z6X1_9PEZI|nr:hypothetical protein N657DRAFT_654829 [Parathielavia appendiculata]
MQQERRRRYAFLAPSMIPTKIRVVDRTRVHRRQNRPCPGGNGATIGTFQEFTVLCNSNIEGDVLDTLDVFDLTACVDLCSSFHPRCEGASFDGSRCTLRTNVRSAEEQALARRIDSAIASFPGASSDCATLGGTEEAVGTTFTTMCGFIIAGNDISQNFAPTFQDCLGQCASTNGCAAVSFDPSQDLGFKNCYLKTAVRDSSDVAADRRTDSAMMAAAVAAPDLSPGASSSPAGPGVSTIPVPQPGSGAVFFTPPGGSTAAAHTPPTPISTPAPTPSLGTATELLIAQNSSLAAGSLPPLLPKPTTTSVSLTESSVPETAGQNAGDGPPLSMAWVAAPIVGSVAAIALIAVSFVMLRRRRRNDGGGKKANISRLPAVSSLFTAWLPSSWSFGSSSSSQPRTESRGSSGREVMCMGNSSKVESGRRRRSAEVSRDRGVVRSSVVGFMIGRPMGMERLEDLEGGEGKDDVSGGTGRMGLRNSLNGLGQNKWSQ